MCEKKQILCRAIWEISDIWNMVTISHTKIQDIGWQHVKTVENTHSNTVGNETCLAENTPDMAWFDVISSSGSFFSSYFFH